MKQTKVIIWSISGADCSGGAGIAADIKTVHKLGGELCHLITANTVQNSTEVTAIHPVDIAILAQQAQALIVDKPPQAIKIGLVANSSQLDWLVTLLKQLKADIPNLVVVFDPVGQASVGGQLSTLSPTELSTLFQYIDVLTPNIVEAKKITQSTSNEMAQLAQQLQQSGIKQAVIKGGHTSSLQCLDYAYTTAPYAVYQLVTERLTTDYSHGSGCSFASALSTFLAQGYLLRDAFTLTKAFIQQGLAYHQGRIGYYGAFEQTLWPAAGEYYPEVVTPLMEQHSGQLNFPRLGIERDGEQALGLYPVVDSVQWLARLMPLGLNIIQLRLKNRSDTQLRDEIKAAVELSHRYDCRLFINDHWQMAIEYGAYGVHIGQEDLIDADLPAIAQAGLRLGISTHGCYEFLLAQQLTPSYLAIGAIFPTKTKDMTGQIQGLDNLRQILSLASDIPIVAIGGINLSRVADVWQTGVDSVAVVTAITEAENPEKVVQDFQRMLI
ncbi:thiamine phosphate synthase [Thalassotalea sp. G2M2-11]|uniref:thiamine phosphate synthase n=1 Tax=Thalassotalea sp. G2M2-11 TaxID=2787627 RepID=UPI0019D21337|nr:thiamine phosphate synthase [Thalassotalea sp. G2M2-11]